MPQNSELCSVVFDEMVIKEAVEYNRERDEVEGLEDFGLSGGRTKLVANHATVFLVRGLMANWKQPLGYFLSSGPMDGKLLHSLLLDCIDRVEEVGLRVKVVVADQGSNNRKAFRLAGVSEMHPFFAHRGEKIHVLFDPPHLLKNIRNNFKKNGFLVDGVTVNWQHMETFYHADKQSPVRIAPKLTDKHISLPPFANLKVKYATQVLSHSIAAGLSTLVHFEVLPEAANKTVEFIDRFDKLFNVFNSSTLKSEKPMGNAFSVKSGHKEFLQEAPEWLHRVQTVNTLPCLSGWKMAIRCLLSLWDDLHQNHGFMFLLTRRLNQDSLETKFSRIRGNSGHVDNPSAGQLRKLIRQAMTDQIFVHSEGSNCAEDGAHFLLNLRSLKNTAQDAVTMQQEQPTQPDEDDVFRIAVPQPSSRDPVLQLAENNVLTYISGYIVRKLASRLCDDCLCLMKGSLSGDEKQVLLVNKRYEYPGSYGGLQVPSAELVRVVEKMQTVFIENVDKVLHADKVCSRLSLIFEKRVTSALVCSAGLCQPTKWVGDLFIKIRLYDTLKTNTASFSTKSARKKRKMMKLCHQ